jgi:hypothetical protein
VEAEPPFFIVGVPRSGTTMLRHMLAGHPRLAIPRESHFVPAALSAPSGAAALDLILATRQFSEWGVDPDVVRDRASRTDMTPSAVVHATFETYAAAQGKPRWGDKTPRYVAHMPQLAAAFPDARFVHILRDGREVATSLRDAWWGPGDLLLAAHEWRRTVAQGLDDAATLPAERYLEVRYQRLASSPEAELTRVLHFLGEEMVDGLLDYADRAISEQPQLPVEHRHLAEPPKAGLRDWRASCTPAEAARLDALLAPTLRRCGLDQHVSSTGWRRAEAEARLLAARYRRRRQRRAEHGTTERPAV